MKTNCGIIKTPAKVNLSLEITGAKGGLHTLKMETMAVDLYEVVAFESKGSGKIDVQFRNVFQGFDEDRFRPIIDKAIDRFVETYGAVGGTLIIDKNIPLGAGIGGSSAVVVGVIKALEKMKNTTVDTQFLLSLGSDLPVIYAGGRNMVYGVGEVVEKLQYEEKYFVILIDGAVDSKEAYALYDKIGFEKYGKRENHLEKSARKLNKGVVESREILENLGAKDVAMSGSGSAVVGIFDTFEEAKMVYEKIGGKSKYLTKSVE